MPYTLKEAPNAKSIAEREFYSASVPGPLQFTKFTSCIGVVGISAGKLIGIHLSILDEQGKPMPKTAAMKVVGLLDYPSACVIFGLLDLWANPENHVDQVYKYLVEALPHAQRLQLKDGIYSAHVDQQGKVQIGSV